MKKKKERPVYVNLGSGTHIVPSTDKIRWINLDKFKVVDHPDAMEGDLLAMPFEKETIDYIYMDNVLEHVPMADVVVALYEIRRVLKKGGRAVIIVPEFKNAIEQWLRFDHDLAFNPVVFNYLSEVIYGNQNHGGEFHRSPFSAGSLHYMLNMVGLRDHKLTMCPEGSDVPDYPGKENKRKIDGRDVILRNAQLVADIIKTT